MINFSTFLTEAASSEDKLKHLEHAEDHPLNAGVEGYDHAVKTLHAVHNAIQGKPSNAHITTKYDGSPSVVFGHHPVTGKFFVASKSAFNANPKLNYTPEDIETNHGHAPGLVDKLKHALRHLPKVAPDSGVYQGDVLHTGGRSVHSKGENYHFTPNTITYSAKKSSPEGRKIAASKFGIAVHTRYKGADIATMKADFQPDLNKFKDHSDVHLVSPVIDPKQAHYSKQTSQEFEQAMSDADKVHKKLLDSKGYKAVEQHGENLKTYVNSTVRKLTKPSFTGYKKFIDERGQKDIDKLKTAAGKATRARVHNNNLQQIDQHKEHITSALKLHGHLQSAKNVLVHALEPAAKGAFDTHIDGEESKGEGTVVTINGRPTKLVDRHEFSLANFNRPRNTEQSTSTEQKEHHGVIAFGRMNPPTVGHVKVAEKVLDVSKKFNAAHRLVVSHTVDSKKNPLTADQKIKHALRMFPKGVNIVAASARKPTILHHAVDMHDVLSKAAALHKKGITHLHVIAGSDRVPEYEQLLNKYNGKESAHGKYDFKKITVHSSGERDPDAEGVSGMSASKMREHAAKGDFKEFKKGIPDHVSEKHKREMFDDVRAGMNIK